MAQTQAARNVKIAVNRLLILLEKVNKQIDQAHTDQDVPADRQLRHLRADYITQLAALLVHLPTGLSLFDFRKRPRLKEVLLVEPFRVFTRWSTGEIRLNDYNEAQAEWLTSDSLIFNKLAEWKHFCTAEVSPQSGGILQWPTVLIDLTNLRGEVCYAPLDFDPLEMYRTGTLLTEDEFEAILKRKAAPPHHSGNIDRSDVIADPSAGEVKIGNRVYEDPGPSDMDKYVGRVKWKQDPLEFQREVRGYDTGLSEGQRALVDLLGFVSLTDGQVDELKAVILRWFDKQIPSATPVLPEIASDHPPRDNDIFEDYEVDIAQERNTTRMSCFLNQLPDYEVNQSEVNEQIRLIRAEYGYN